MQIDSVLQREDEKCLKRPLELQIVEAKLWLEEEKFILGLLKKEFSKKYHVTYNYNTNTNNIAATDTSRFITEVHQ